MKETIIASVVSAIISAIVISIFGWFWGGIKDIKATIDTVPRLEKKIDALITDKYLKLPVFQGRVQTKGNETGNELAGVVVEQYLIIDKDESIPECNSKEHRGRVFLSAISGQAGEDGLVVM